MLRPAVLAAALKAAMAPAPTRTVRLTALLAMEPQLLTPSLSSEESRPLATFGRIRGNGK